MDERLTGWKKSLGLICSLVLLMHWGGASYAAVGAETGPATEKVSDIRILIDISGSMKRNDPNNLRVPALRLITQLLPNGSQASVWTFGQYVNMLVKQGKVDAAWKEQAAAAATKVNSLGMYTNLEGVLEKSSWDWTEPDPAVERTVILLTDGLVDVSKSPDEDAASRKRILDTTLNRLKAAGATVHTIALSEDADKAFLGQLAAATSGWYEEIADSAKLERVFLKMFEKSVDVESLPLNEDGVMVDNSIKELTLLVFRSPGARIAELIQPDSTRYDYRNAPSNVHWLHEERYDLVTVTEPMPGLWKVDAAVDPDNRVMVVTDLKLRTSTLPNIVLQGDTYPYFAELQEDGKAINKPEFLMLVRVGLEQARIGGEQTKLAIADKGQSPDAKAGDGRYSTTIGAALRPGDYEFKLLVDGTTFKRARNHKVRVVSAPALVTTKLMSDGNPAHYMLSVVPYTDLVDSDTVQVDATISKVGGGQMAATIPRVGPNEWRLEMDIDAGDVFDLDLDLQAARIGGKEKQHYPLGSYRLGGDGQTIEKREPAHITTEAAAPAAPSAPVVEEPVADEHADEPSSVDAEVQDEVLDPEAEVVDATEESPNWIMVIVKVLGFNLLIIGVGFFVYKKWFAKPAAPKGDDEDADEGKDADQKKGEAKA